VSASSLALHLDCSRTYMGKLEAEGVIQRQGGGFQLDQSRVAYLRYLRRERQQSPRTAADAEHALAKATLLRIRIEEKQRTLVLRADVDALIDGIAGTVLTHLSSLPARCALRGDRDPAQHRAGRVRGAHRDCECLPADGRQVRRAAGRGVELTSRSEPPAGGPDPRNTGSRTPLAPNRSLWFD
jgi:hypothetical protein